MIGHPSNRRLWPLALLPALVAAGPGPATPSTQDAPTPRAAQEPAAKATADAQQLDGVITRVERVGAPDAARIRVTVNTAAVWRDYVRDTARTAETKPEQVAQDGQQGVAQQGQPRDADTLVTVELVPDARLELRYRAAMDEASPGAATADEARAQAQADPQAADAASRRARQSDARPGPKLAPDRLKPGLFVHLAYARADGANRARHLIVLEPVRDRTPDR